MENIDLGWETKMDLLGGKWVLIKFMLMGLPSSSIPYAQVLGFSWVGLGLMHDRLAVLYMAYLHQ